jgi:hypothetical protein
VQLTFGDKSSFNPKWCPDGNWIAFISNRKDNKKQHLLLNRERGEAEPLTGRQDRQSQTSPGPLTVSRSPFAWLTRRPKKRKERQSEKRLRWVDENMKLSRLYVISRKKTANGKREPRKLTTDNYNVERL